MAKNNRVLLTPEVIEDWKQSCVDYLQGLYGKPLGDLLAVLKAPGALRCSARAKRSTLMEPYMAVTEAYFLRKGSAKLYTVNPENGEEKIMYIWTEGSVIVMFAEFRERLPNVEFYIQLMEDSELVTLGNFCLDGLYETNTVAHALTQKILMLKTKRRMLQMDILLMLDKRMRYAMMKKSFPELFVDGECRLTNNEICSFINISESTLLEARKFLVFES